MSAIPSGTYLHNPGIICLSYVHCLEIITQVGVVNPLQTMATSSYQNRREEGFNVFTFSASTNRK